MKISLLALPLSLMLLHQSAFAEAGLFSIHDGDGFKRFSVSAGWLHVMPQGKANPVNINTAIAENTSTTVGEVKASTVLNNLKDGKTDNAVLEAALKLLGDNNVPAVLSGTADIRGLSQWTSAGTGLEAEEVDTLGLLFNYYFSDNVSMQVIGGIPPKVDIQGKGQVYAPFEATGHTALGDVELKNDLLITDLANQGKAASARAWTPAVELQYQFGKSGVNKFRPYIGAGVMYAYFDDIKLNKGIESDLIAAGHMIQNIHDGAAGAALENKTSSASPRVKLDASDAFAPIVTAGFTYDFKQNWFASASVSYAKLNNDATISVINDNTGQQLINAKTKIDIDPLITYLGVGYRF